ncbi:MAG: hypothetical protein OHK0052_04960 [Anaerolineales bacterium]
MLFSRFLGWFFKHLYTTWARLYDAVAWSVSLGAWNKWILSLLPDLTGEAILELGHGPGHLQAALHAQGSARRIVGFDASRQMGRLAQARLEQLGFPAALTCGYAQQLPFTNTCFQQVVATFPSEYIADPLTLDEIRRVLLPGGELLILPVAVPRQFALRALFHVTGQAPASTALQHTGELFCNALIQHGFTDTRAEIRKTKTASLLIVSGKAVSNQQ